MTDYADQMSDRDQLDQLLEGTVRLCEKCGQPLTLTGGRDEHGNFEFSYACLRVACPLLSEDQQGREE